MGSRSWRMPMADLLCMSDGRLFPTMSVFHHFPGIRRQIAFDKRVLCVIVMDKGNDVGNFFAGKHYLPAKGLFLSRQHTRCVVPHFSDEVERA